MDTTTTKNVMDIPSTERQALEHLLACIAHGVGRIKPAANAGTAQTRISGHHTLSHGSRMNWRAPLRQSLGLLGPAYDSGAQFRLGAPLEPQQSVMIFSYTPGTLPADAAREAARVQIEQMMATNQQLAANEGITAEESDAAIDEAMTQVRKRR